ncbi:hypothetical protein ASPBRDRAFT_60329 [Aspergillus brasiliensis CBS 101740]|uniref:Uncharacterized protein n=1 Tax=Aspergillus brasiliensis (strain CBS 101740 / IMI 381727 / IBT 21946) TaxID=767769 RepID=A0A1L9U1Y1_ASPBC|nr:hypothetical protein ASPBRDRAFT_60329 [Aspergillus brasiliensis CBS 101740]
MPTLTSWNDDVGFEVSDIQVTVNQAFEQGQRVTVIGTMHSTTQYMVNTAIIISLKNIDGLISTISSIHTNNIAIIYSAQFSLYILVVKLVTPAGYIMEISESQNKEYLPIIHSYNNILGNFCEVIVHIFKTQPSHVSFQVAQIDTFLDGFAAGLQTLKKNYDEQCRESMDPEIPRTASPGAWLDPIESKNISLFEVFDRLCPSAKLAALINSTLVYLPLGINLHSSYIINPCDRAILWAHDDPDFEFYDWVFLEKWWDTIRAFQQLNDRFRREHDFTLPLPTSQCFTTGPACQQDSRWAIGNFANAADLDCIRRFLQICKQLDPKNLFLNDYFKTMFTKYF